MSRHILVTGAGGMLGSRLLTVLGTVNPGNTEDLEVTENDNAGNLVTGWSYRRPLPGLQRIEATSRAQVDRYFAEHLPQVCVHCVAAPDVQACERDPRMAHLLNAASTENVAQACARHGTKLVYLSTEYVFDGSSRDGYREDDAPNPLQTYGETKLLGERYAAQVPGALTVRLPVLYGDPVPGRTPTWLEAMLEALEQGRPVDLDDHYERQPTWSHDVAAVLARVIADDLTGVLHVAAQEGATKYVWGRAVAEAAGLPSALLRPSRPSPGATGGARRPERPWLRTDRLESLGLRPPAGIHRRAADYLRSTSTSTSTSGSTPGQASAGR
ncbi:SDR family oxidoreductase [Streptomyces mayonensis]|uniref:SDR family oxidoreductase n=1 Tax=Streptomyces mayonensis TaxID=2750816 RepID=UPI001C1E13D8|nr:SDR family oxidoreductase [Streptomyces sp. A108]MBU6531389.1 SDR family oxidoreductase [Streptomyces sp. A108]